MRTLEPSGFPPRSTMASDVPNERLTLAVARMLAKGTPSTVVQERLSVRFGVTTRTVRDYIAAAEEQRDEDDRALASRYRKDGIFVARAACAKWIVRGDKLYTLASRLLARADRFDGGENAIGDRLMRQILRAGRRLDDGPVDDDRGDIDPTAASVALESAREDRRQATILIKRAEGCDARALDWFDRGAKIAGAYEAATTAPESTRVQLTSPQRRAKLNRIGELIREHKAKGAIQ